MLKFGNKNDVTPSYKCTIRLLDDSEVLECEIQLTHKGSYLLTYVCQQLNLEEKDYFGLRYVDASRQRHWLDLGKSVLKQVKDLDPILFSFRVKFYPPDPFRLKEEITRYQIYLQLKRDLLHGRLYCTQTEAAQLAAFIVQGELGDYDSEEHSGNYVADLKILLKQTEPIEEKIIELHKALKGQTPSQMESAFLEKACKMDTYGVDPHPVKDHRSNTLYLGINHLGILTFQGSRKTHHFSWSQVQKINYEGKMFIIHLVYHEDPRTKKKHTVGFKCVTGAACRHVWRCAVEQMLFFTLSKSKDAPVVSGGGFLSFGSTKFKYKGRTERELLDETANGDRRPEPTVHRVSSLRRKASSVPATPSTPIGSEIGSYCTLPRSLNSVADSRLGGSSTLVQQVVPSESAPAGLEPVAELDHPESPSINDENHKAMESASVREGVQPNQISFSNLHPPGLKDIDALTDDYSFRDSFDLSTNDPQFSHSHRSSRSQTPQPASTSAPLLVRRNSLQTALLPSTVINNSAHPSLHSKKPVRRFNVFKVFVPAFVCVSLTLILLTVLVLESNHEFLAGLRHMPELMAFRREIYDPVKAALSRRLGSFWRS